MDRPTKAQMAVLGCIGTGNYSPIAAKSTIAALIRKGWIVEIPPRTERFGSFGVMTIKQYDMPIMAHVAWREMCSDEQAPS